MIIHAPKISEQPLSHETLAAIAEAAQESGFGDPNQVALPEPEDSAATVAWLEGEGVGAVALVMSSAALYDRGDIACSDFAEQLDEWGSPADLHEAVLGISDPVTADVLGLAYIGTVDMLGSCRDDRATSGRRNEHAWQWSLAHRRLVELGIIAS